MKLDSRMSHFGKRNERAIRPALAGRPGKPVKWFLFSKLCLLLGSAHVFTKTKIPNFTNVSQLNKKIYVPTGLKGILFLSFEHVRKKAIQTLHNIS